MNIEEKYRKELTWWFAELTSDAESLVEKYLAIFPELNSRLSKFGVGILLWNMNEMIDIENPDDVNRVGSILKALDNSPAFDFFDRTFNGADPETVCKIIGLSPMDPVAEAPLDFDYSVNYIESYDDARDYLDMASWREVISEEYFNARIAKGSRFYFCGNGEWWDTPCVPGIGFPHDCFGYSLIAVEVTSEDKISSITSRWDGCAGDNGNFITEEELRTILGDVNFRKLFCNSTGNH